MKILKYIIRKNFNKKIFEFRDNYIGTLYYLNKK